MSDAQHDAYTVDYSVTLTKFERLGNAIKEERIFGNESSAASHFGHSVNYALIEHKEIIAEVFKVESWAKSGKIVHQVKTPLYSFRSANAGLKRVWISRG